MPDVAYLFKMRKNNEETKIKFQFKDDNIDEENGRTRRILIGCSRKF